ncbi:MAG TPA: LysR family transcriptional regulator [Chthoniobacteraceae bacterium]|nr:LysR family transcriptional regulator [Chthoniobacteraceae bacterium]
MNIHYLELFYYVARHGGVTEAAKNIPYGIQQPAISGQVARLEESLGVTLFQRRPFALTPAGKQLFEFIKPFFANLDKVEGEIQGGRAVHIRVGASNIVMREHLPELFQGVRGKFRGLKLSLREGAPETLEDLLRADEIDLAVTLIERKPPPDVHSLALLEIPVVLLVHKDCPVKSAEELWKRDRIEEPLICMPQTVAISRNFQAWLAKKRVEWFPSIEVSSSELIEIYVAGGFGIGFTIPIPNHPLPANVRALPLKGFPPAVIGMMWRGPKSALIETFLDEGKKRANKLQ